MRHPAALTPRPARAQPPADPAQAADNPLPGTAPPSQPARAHRAAQPPRRQPPLDHARNNAYRDHRCLRAPRAALPPPRPRERREGRRLPGPDHGGVAHKKGQPRRAALPAILTTNDASSPLRPHSQGRGTRGRVRVRGPGQSPAAVIRPPADHRADAAVRRCDFAACNGTAPRLPRIWLDPVRLMEALGRVLGPRSARHPS